MQLRMRNGFAFLFFDGESDAEEPFASTEMSAESLVEMHFAPVSQGEHPDLLVHWSQRSLAYLNAGLDVYRIEADTAYEVFSQDTLHFDWNYFGKDSLTDWPMLLASDESYRELTHITIIHRDKGGVAQMEAIVRQEVVQDAGLADEFDASQLQPLHLIGIDTLHYIYDADRHLYLNLHAAE
jgi:hypothetical protein